MSDSSRDAKTYTTNSKAIASESFLFDFDDMEVNTAIEEADILAKAVADASINEDKVEAAAMYCCDNDITIEEYQYKESFESFQPLNEELIYDKPLPPPLIQQQQQQQQPMLTTTDIKYENFDPIILQAVYEKIMQERREKEQKKLSPVVPDREPDLPYAAAQQPPPLLIKIKTPPVGSKNISMMKQQQQEEKESVSSDSEEDEGEGGNGNNEGEEEEEDDGNEEDGNNEEDGDDDDDDGDDDNEEEEADDDVTDNNNVDDVTDTNNAAALVQPPTPIREETIYTDVTTTIATPMREESIYKNVVATPATPFGDSHFVVPSDDDDDENDNNNTNDDNNNKKKKKRVATVAVPTAVTAAPAATANVLPTNLSHAIREPEEVKIQRKSVRNTKIEIISVVEQRVLSRPDIDIKMHVPKVAAVKIPQCKPMFRKPLECKLDKSGVPQSLTLPKVHGYHTKSEASEFAARGERAYPNDLVIGISDLWRDCVSRPEFKKYAYIKQRAMISSYGSILRSISENLESATFVHKVTNNISTDLTHYTLVYGAVPLDMINCTLEVIAFILNEYDKSRPAGSEKNPKYAPIKDGEIELLVFNYWQLSTQDLIHWNDQTPRKNLKRLLTHVWNMLPNGNTIKTNIMKLAAFDDHRNRISAECMWYIKTNFLAILTMVRNNTDYVNAWNYFMKQSKVHHYACFHTIIEMHMRVRTVAQSLRKQVLELSDIECPGIITQIELQRVMKRWVDKITPASARDLCSLFDQIILWSVRELTMYLVRNAHYPRSKVIDLGHMQGFLGFIHDRLPVHSISLIESIADNTTMHKIKSLLAIQLMPYDPLQSAPKITDDAFTLFIEFIRMAINYAALPATQNGPNYVCGDDDMADDEEEEMDHDMMSRIMRAFQYFIDQRTTDGRRYDTWAATNYDDPEMDEDFEIDTEDETDDDSSADEEDNNKKADDKNAAAAAADNATPTTDDKNKVAEVNPPPEPIPPKKNNNKNRATNPTTADPTTTTAAANDATKEATTTTKADDATKEATTTTKADDATKEATTADNEDDNESVFDESIISEAEIKTILEQKSLDFSPEPSAPLPKKIAKRKKTAEKAPRPGSSKPKKTPSCKIVKVEKSNINLKTKAAAASPTHLPLPGDSPTHLPLDDNPADPRASMKTPPPTKKFILPVDRSPSKPKSTAKKLPKISASFPELSTFTLLKTRVSRTKCVLCDGMTTIRVIEFIPEKLALAVCVICATHIEYIMRDNKEAVDVNLLYESVKNKIKLPLLFRVNDKNERVPFTPDTNSGKRVRLSYNRYERKQSSRDGGDDDRSHKKKKIISPDIVEEDEDDDNNNDDDDGDGDNDDNDYDGDKAMADD